MNCLIDNTNICTSVYQSVHCTLWYTPVLMLVLYIKQFVNVMTWIQLRLTLPNRQRIYTITETSRRIICEIVHFNTCPFVGIIYHITSYVSPFGSNTQNISIGMMRLFCWNMTRRHWLIDSLLHPRQMETSSVPLWKPQNIVWGWSYCVCCPAYQCADSSMTRGKEIWFQSIVLCYH